MRVVYCDGCASAHGWPLSKDEERQLAYCDLDCTLGFCNSVQTKHLIRDKVGDDPMQFLVGIIDDLRVELYR